MFHLYRIYGLEPVIHENLRPEKPPKPFVRGKGRVLVGDGDADGEDQDGEDVAEAVDGTPRRRTKARTEGKDTVGDESAGGDLNGEVELEAPSKPKAKRRRTATNVVAGDVPAPSVSPRKRKRVFAAREKRSVVGAEEEVERAEELVNQEDEPEPVDGARAGEVEAEEHPEAVQEGDEHAETVREEARECLGRSGA